MRTSYCICAILIHLSWQGVVYSQHYTGTMFQVANGLPSSELLSIERDGQGYLWIGSNAGITKYDGYSFETFQYSSDNELIGKVNTLKEDRQHRLWIGTDAGLFFRFGKKIRKFSADTKRPQGINKIFEDKYSNIYLATELGPAFIPKLVTDTAVKIHIQDFILPGWPNTIAGLPGIGLISQAEDETVYFSSRFTLYRFTKNLIKPIYHYDDIHDIILNLIPVNVDKVIFFAGQSNWHKIEQGSHSKLDLKEMLKPGITLSKSKRWLSSNRILFQFDPLQEIVSSMIDLDQYNTVWASDVLADPQNIIWIASHDGLLKLQPSVFKTYPAKKFPMVEEIYSMYETRDNQFLMGANRGKLIHFQENDSLEYSSISPVVTLAEVKSMIEDDRGWFWIGTGYQGIVLYRDSKRYHFMEEQGLRDNNNMFLYKTRKGRLFATGDKGLTEIIVSGANELISFRNHFLQPHYSQHATLNACVEGPADILWCAGLEGLYYLKDDSLHTYKLNERQISVADIKIDYSGDLWIVTEGDGIFQCSFNAQHLPVMKTHYTSKDGLNTNLFMKILFDKQGNRWLTSYNGISFISRDDGTILNFDGGEIFPNMGFNSFFLYMDIKGRIWGGSSKGITSFDPLTITKSSYVPPAYITQVSLTNSGDDIFAYASDNREALPEGLTLPSNKNYLRFQYVAIDYSNQQNLQYYYQLSGWDDSWINGGNQRSVIYQHLPAGRYTFNVKALNNKGVWSYTATYKFIISKPFWATSWFIIFLIVTTCAVIFFIIKKRDRAFRRKAEKEMLIERQISDLKIKALRAKMNPHFIFNCLNSIDNLIQTDEKDMATTYLAKFAKLIRAILEHSKHNVIPCWKDLESLKLYLELEEFRFNNKFTYHMKIADEILEGDYKVPPLIIQPFVENAIHHGLLNKQFGARDLWVEVTVDDNNTIKYTITDNGVGRARANIYKEINGDTHFSMGMEVTIDRINLFNNSDHGGVKITDIKDANNDAAGTQIEIWLLN